MNKSDSEFEQVIEMCFALFSNKLEDYSTAWRVLRLPSLTDQIFIKAKRTRTLQDSDVKMIDEDEEGEFIAIVNYCIIALINMDLGIADSPDISPVKARELYKKYASKAQKLMRDKSHDYGQAWREMRISSFSDIILQKLHRIKQIEDNKGVTKVSEGIDANYYDILNYAVFALIKFKEVKN